MKKTVTAILSLAMAIIMVSSLSSGVILAKDDDDNDNRKRNKNKYHTVRDVAILDCGFVFGSTSMELRVIGFDTNAPVDNTPDIYIGTTPCVEGIAIILEDRFKMENGSAGMAGFNIHSRYTFLRSRRVKN